MAHMIGVAEYMRENASKYDLDPDMAYTVGLLHDIGYLEGRRGHEQVSAKIYASICSTVNPDIFDAILYHGSTWEEIPKTSISLLLIEADMSVNAQGFRVGFDKRLMDIKERYGEDSDAYRNVKNIISQLKIYKENIK
jgi:putative nucleotidyltransferase with HDIG domain